MNKKRSLEQEITEATEGNLFVLRMKIGRVDLSKPVWAGDTAATFRVDLPRGKAELRTWFYDAEGKELCGAFYVEALCEAPSVNGTPPNSTVNRTP